MGELTAILVLVVFLVLAFLLAVLFVTLLKANFKRKYGPDSLTEFSSAAIPAKESGRAGSTAMLFGMGCLILVIGVFLTVIGLSSALVFCLPLALLLCGLAIWQLVKLYRYADKWFSRPAEERKQLIAAAEAEKKAKAEKVPLSACETPEWAEMTEAQKDSAMLAEFMSVLLLTWDRAYHLLNCELYDMQEILEPGSNPAEKLEDSIFRKLGEDAEEREERKETEKDLVANVFSENRLVKKADEYSPEFGRKFRGLLLLRTACGMTDVLKQASEKKKSLCLHEFAGMYQENPDITDCDVVIRFTTQNHFLKKKYEEELQQIQPETRDTLNLDIRNSLLPFFRKYGDRISDNSAE